MAVEAVAQKGVSVALACRTFGVSERCYRYEPKLKSENERIGDLLIGLTLAEDRNAYDKIKAAGKAVLVEPTPAERDAIRASGSRRIRCSTASSKPQWRATAMPMASMSAPSTA